MDNAALVDVDDFDVPDYSLTPTVVPVEPDDTSILCSDWKGCFASLAVIMVAVGYGAVCAVVGYQYHLKKSQNCSLT